MSILAKFNALSGIKKATAIIVFVMALASLCKGAYHTMMAAHGCYNNDVVLAEIEPIKEEVEICRVGLSQLLIQDQIREQSQIMRGYINDFGDYEQMPPSVKREYEKARDRKEELERQLEKNTDDLFN